MTDGAGAKFERLVAIMRALRAPGGCPWDREQTHRSLRPFVLEETYELLEAIESGSAAELCEELGDFLYEAVFLAQISEEAGDFSIGDALDAIADKLVRRHPHVFGEAEARTAERVRLRWERIKSEQEGREGVFHHVPGSLPALLHARKVQRRAAAVGYDWPDLHGPLAKLREELQELEREVAHSGPPAPETEPDPALVHEVGDLLFTVVNVARRLNVDPELALRATSSRFVARVERAERLAAEAGETWAELDLAAQDGWYERAKAEERVGPSP